ncbi:hypothetical protein ACXZ9C_10635 [Streptococcus agalactiae]
MAVSVAWRAAALVGSASRRSMAPAFWLSGVARDARAIARAARRARVASSSRALRRALAVAHGERRGVGLGVV